MAQLKSQITPTPEIWPEEAARGGALVIGTGSSDFPNQINNVLAFPGVFRGALDAKATEINEDMKLAAAIAAVAESHGLWPDYITPDVFDTRVVVPCSRCGNQSGTGAGVG